MKKVLVIGSKGMAGHMIRQVLLESHSLEVIDISRSNKEFKSSYSMDLYNLDGLTRILKSEQPDIVINCAGILNDAVEANPDEGIFVNSFLPHFLASRCKRLIHISTDCVFSGDKGNYIEDDTKDGRGFYAQSKAIGEINNNKDLTIRTSIIGPELKLGGIGLFHWFAQQQGEIKGYTNAVWSGVTTVEMGKAIIVAIDQNLSGVYHLVNNEKISKFDLLSLLKNEFKSSITHIDAFEDYNVDKSLLNTRRDFNYEVSSYRIMVKELKGWIQNHAALYPHYSHLLNL